MSSLFSIVCTSLFLVVAMVQGDSIQEYFPDIGDDLTLVTWAHAVNSKQLLQAALEDEMMMLEADVVLGTVVGGTGELIPIMGHPPATTSDLSLKNFLSGVLAATEKGHRCGIKLDFKSVEVLEPSLQEIQLLSNQINFPVMLNADILPGPLNSTVKPVDADSFLQLCVDEFPGSTLSVGWTTRYGGIVFSASYTEDQVKQMEAVLKKNNVTQPVTFPVRAGIAAKSSETLMYLKEKVENCTFTVWSSDLDPVDVELLRKLIVEDLGRDRVFVDVPKRLMDQLELKTVHMEALQVQKYSHAGASVLSSTLALVVSSLSTLLYLSK